MSQSVKPSPRRPSFRPFLERLESRDCPSQLLWDPPNTSTDWTVTGNWDKDGSWQNHPLFPPGAGDQVTIGGTTHWGNGNNNCFQASGTVSSIAITGGYTGTLQLSGDLTAGDPQHSSTLNGSAAAQVDVNGHTLKFVGPADVWTVAAIQDTAGRGTIDFAGTATATMTYRQLCYTELTVDGKLTFTNAGGLDFGANGAVNVQNSGLLVVQSADPVKYDVTFTAGAGNINSWLVQNSGRCLFNEPGKTVTVPLTISGHNLCMVTVGSETHLTATGAHGLRFYDSSNLWEYAGVPGATTVTTISATNGVTMNDSSIYLDGYFNNTFTEADLIGALTFNNSSSLFMGTGSTWSSVVQPIFSVSGNVAFNATSTFHTTIQGDAGGFSGVELVCGGSLTWDAGKTVKMVIDFEGSVFWTAKSTPVITTVGGINNAIGTYTDNVSGQSTPNQGANNFDIDT